MAVEIIPANLRDCTYIGANMRPQDAREVFCQIPEGMSGSDFAAHAFTAFAQGWAWVALINGNPVCFFGFQPVTAAVWQGFAVGTRKMIRAVPAMTAHCLAQEARLVEAGCRRLEVRTIEGHDLSRRWLKHLGCKFVCPLPDSGRNGESFDLYTWTLSDGLPSQLKDYRNVPSQSAEAPEAPAAALAS